MGMEIFIGHHLLKERQPSKPQPTLENRVIENVRGLSLSKKIGGEY